MKKQKTILELLILLRKQVVKQSYRRFLIDKKKLYSYQFKNSVGLCSVISTLESIGVISGKEHVKLKNYLYCNRPEETKEDIYFWEKGLFQPRLDWIDIHIQLNS